MHGLDSCNSRALELDSAVAVHGLSSLRHGDLPGPSIELVSPASADGFFTTEPSGKPKKLFFSPYFIF